MKLVVYLPLEITNGGCLLHVDGFIGAFSGGGREERIIIFFSFLVIYITFERRLARVSHAPISVVIFFGRPTATVIIVADGTHYNKSGYARVHKCPSTISNGHRSKI